MIGRSAAAAVGVVLVVAGCSGAPRPDPVGVAAEDFPPQAVSPSGILGDASVGAESLSDPALDTAGDPFVP